MISTKDLFKTPCEFLRGVTVIDQLPDTQVVEVAFAGRSNVGKSSLINAITRRKALARVSKTPGCTQQLNFFTFDERLRIVDLPGYGYAKASRQEVDGWNLLIHQYLLGRPNLRQAFVLIDSRHGAKENDEEIMRLLDTDAVAYQIVLTKVDKIRENELRARFDEIETLRTSHPALHPDTLATSSEQGAGLEGVRNRLAELASNG